MKRNRKRYIKPNTETVKLNVNGDILDYPINPDSKGSHASDAWAKRHNFFDDDDESAQGNSGSSAPMNIWED